MTTTESHQRESAIKGILSLPVLLAAVAALGFYFTIGHPESQIVDSLGSEDQTLESVVNRAKRLEPSKLMADNKPDVAVQKVSELLDKNPRDPAVNLCAGNIYFQLGKTDEAFKLLKKAVALAPRIREVRLNLAQKLLVNQQYEEAIGQLKLLTLAYPHWSAAREVLADCYLKTENPGAAAGELKEAIDSNPNDGALRKQRGLALAQIGQGRDGLIEYSMGDAIEHNFHGLSPELKEVVADWGSMDRAIFELKRELSVRPYDSSVKLTLGKLLMYTGQLTDAKTVLIDARRKDPTDPEIRRTLALVLQKLGATNPAVTEFVFASNLERGRQRPQGQLSKTQ